MNTFTRDIERILNQGERFRYLHERILFRYFLENFSLGSTDMFKCDERQRNKAVYISQYILRQSMDEFYAFLFKATLLLKINSHKDRIFFEELQKTRMYCD